jgi:hypothetical protein
MTHHHHPHKTMRQLRELSRLMLAAARALKLIEQQGKTT